VLHRFQTTQIHHCLCISRRLIDLNLVILSALSSTSEDEGVCITDLWDTTQLYKFLGKAGRARCLAMLTPIR
jgi:hypothetical protein